MRDPLAITPDNVLIATLRVHLVEPVSVTHFLSITKGRTVNVPAVIRAEIRHATLVTVATGRIRWMTSTKRFPATQQIALPATQMARSLAKIKAAQLSIRRADVHSWAEA
jgi:hypothetical protein